MDDLSPNGIIRINKLDANGEPPFPHRHTGMILYETDTNTLYTYNGGRWQEWGIITPPGRQMRFPWMTR